jgi:hypothetical protein
MSPRRAFEEGSVKPTTRSKWLVLTLVLGLLAFWSWTCSDREYYDGGTIWPGDGDIDVDVDGDGDIDGDSDGDSDGDTDVDSDSDSDPTDCDPGALFCHEGRIYECNETGTDSTMVLDCSIPPYSGCVVDFCDSGQTEAEPCCTSSSAFCHAEVGVSDEAPITIDFTGTWDDWYSCTGQTLDEAEFLFRVDSRAIACEVGFVQILISGDLADFPEGTAVPICQGGLSTATIRMSVTESTGGDMVAVTYSGADCSHASGTMTLFEWGAGPGEAFRLEADVSLWNGVDGTGRSLVIGGDGTLVVY